MNLARFSVNRPVAAGIISIAIFVLGLFYLKGLPVALYPDVSLPFISITVPLPGATPEQLEKRVVKPLEKEIASLKSVKRIIAHIRPSAATVVVGFSMDMKKQEALDNVREKVQIVRAEFPKDAKDPIVASVDLGATPILIYGIESQQSPEATKKILEDGLIRDLQKTNGVSEAMVVGLGDEEVEITLDPEKLAGMRIAPLDVYQQLSTSVASIPWGDIHQSGHLLAVTRATLPQDPAYWNEFQISLADGRNLRLGEIGSARITRESDAALVRINGKPGLGLVVMKRADANTLETVRTVEKTVAAIDSNLGLKLFPIIDQSNYIEENTHEVWIALFVGGAFAVLVILFFLTDIKSALITATALPVSIAGTFIFMSYMGFSVNMMSLLALALAIGLLIDDAVVVREAIFSEIESGKSAREAAVSGTDKVASAVLATTLAIIAVFLPVSAMQGMVGQFFKEFGLTIAIAAVISLWVAFTLDPMLSAKFGGHHKLLAGSFWDKWRALMSWSEEFAARIAKKAFNRPSLIILSSIGLFILSAALIFSRGADFLAFEDRGQLVVNLAAPSGSSKEITEKLSDEAYARLKDLDGLIDIYSTVGGKDQSRAEMRLVFTPKNERKRGLLDIQREANQRLNGINGDFLVLEPPPVEGVGVEAPLSIFIYGENFDQMFAEGERLTAALNKIPGIAKARLETSRHSPSIDISLNQNEMGYWSTNANAVELSGRLALTGLEAGSVGSENTPLFVRYDEKNRTVDTLWNETYVPTPKGPVLIGQLATHQDSANPSSIDRERRSRKVIVWGTLDRSRAYELVLADVEKELQKIKPPLSAEIAGDKEMFEEMASNFQIAILGSAFFIFVILAIQFENLLRPFIILLSLPLAAIGAFLALFFMGEKLALGALIGIILLIGLAAKNGILLVDAIGVKEKSMSLYDAVISSTRERFRPIVMTSIAMIFGMVPTAFMRGSGSEFRAPMAIAIIGGVISSMILSVIVIPAIFGLIAKFRLRREKKQPQSLDRPIAASLSLALALVSGLSFIAPTPAKAQEFPEAKPADMSQIIDLIKREPHENSKEAYQIMAIQEAASGFTSASRLAFLGSLRLEAGREWTKPGVTQKFTLPLPGGAVTQDLVVVPQVQNTYTVGWGLSLFNMQIVRGLKVARITREQETFVTKLQKETYAQTLAQLLLQYEMQQKIREVHTERVDIAAARLATVQEGYAAGTMRRTSLDEATAALESARADLEQAKAQIERYRSEFLARSGLALPPNGFGLPQFPLANDRPFNPLALKALTGTENIKEAVLQATNATFYPTVDLTLAHQRKEFEPNPPDPQNIVGLKFSWTLLDAGTRRRNAAEATQQLYQAKAETAGAQTQLKVAYDTFAARYQGAQHGLAARKAAYRAADQAAEDMLSAFRSGSARLIDVRKADEARLGAALSVYQSAIELQGLALESLVLTDSLLDYLEQKQLSSAPAHQSTTKG